MHCGKLHFEDHILNKAEQVNQYVKMPHCFAREYILYVRSEVNSESRVSERKISVIVLYVYILSFLHEYT